MDQARSEPRRGVRPVAAGLGARDPGGRSAQRERQRHEPPAARLRHLPGGGHAAGEGDLVHVALDQRGAGLAGAQQHLERFGQAVGVLQDSLDLSQGRVATSLLSLYLYCGDLARQGRWGEAANILSELRDAWETSRREK